MTSLADIRMIERELGWNDRLAAASQVIDTPGKAIRERRTDVAVTAGLVLLSIVAGVLLGGALYLVYLA